MYFYPSAYLQQCIILFIKWLFGTQSNCKICLHTRAILGYTYSLLKLMVVEYNKYGFNFKVAVYLVYPLLSKFNVLIDTSNTITIIITSWPLTEM